MNSEHSHDKKILKKFNFYSKDNQDSVEILIDEIMSGTYSFYTWPAAKVLAQFVFYIRRYLPGKNVLEIGAGTSLPGILAAKLGANVTLTDSGLLPKTLANIERICNLNKLKPGADIKVVGLTWGMLGHDFYDLGSNLDLIIGSDCLYDHTVFDDLIASIAFLLEHNHNARFVCSYQFRTSDYSIENLLKKWNLSCRNIDLDSISNETGVDVKELGERHTIYLLEITRKS